MVSIKKVFISYAWETDDFNNSVWQLAVWLHENSGGLYEVIIDKLYSIKPPKEGWPIWMKDQVELSDIVLMVCTEKYKKSFEKRGNGKGVIYEGAIITDLLYSNQMVNEKTFPIIPDGGLIEHVPIITKAWFNNHCFPSGNIQIKQLILGENPTFSASHSLLATVPQSQEDISNVDETLAEKIIVNEMIEPSEKLEVNMYSPITELVHAFVGLDFASKKQIIKVLNIDDSSLENLKHFELDKNILLKVKEMNLQKELWDEINKIKPFTITINPFNH